EAGKEVGHAGSVARAGGGPRLGLRPRRQTSRLRDPPPGADARSVGFLIAGVPVATAHFPRSAMLSLIQRVSQASVSVDGETLGRIGSGLVALVGVEPGDGEEQVTRMAGRLLGYRVFA